MEEGHLRVLGCHLQDVRVEVAEGGREEHLCAVQVDHALHGLLDVHGLGDLLLLEDLDAGQLRYARRALGVGLVVAIVILGADVDEAHDRLGRVRRAVREQERERGDKDRVIAIIIPPRRYSSRSPDETKCNPG